MANRLRAEAIITAKNQLRPGLTSAARDLQRFRAQQTKITSALAATGRSLAFAAAPLVSAAAAAQAVKRYADVNRQMTRIGVTGDATVRQVEEGTRRMRDLALETATPFDEIAKGMDKITASGRGYMEGLDMLPSIARTAVASGGAMDDIADSSVAMLDHMKVPIQQLEAAQDALAKAGKLGKFELKDMARYLPSILPRWKELGFVGVDGMERLSAILQTIRSGTGTAEEAASSAQNIFQKMFQKETLKNFKDLGVDWEKIYADTRKRGGDVWEVFLDSVEKAIKGDSSKLSRLFNDSEVQRGIIPSLQLREKTREYLAEIRNARGTVAADLKRVIGDQKSELDRISESFDRATTAVGSNISALSKWLGAGERVIRTLQKVADVAEEKSVDGPVVRPGSMLAKPKEPEAFPDFGFRGLRGGNAAGPAHDARDAAAIAEANDRTAYLNRFAMGRTAERAGDDRRAGHLPPSGPGLFGWMERNLPLPSFWAPDDPSAASREWVKAYRGAASRQGGITPGQSIARENELSDLAERLVAAFRQAEAKSGGAMPEGDRQKLVANVSGIVREMLNLENARNGLAAADAGQVKSMVDSMLGSIAKQPVDVKGEVTGEAKLNITVTASPELTAKIDSLNKEVIKLRGQVSRNGAGGGASSSSPSGLNKGRSMTELGM